MKPLRRPKPRRLRKATPAELRAADRKFLGYEVQIQRNPSTANRVAIFGNASVEMKFVVS